MENEQFIIEEPAVGVEFLRFDRRVLFLTIRRKITLVFVIAFIVTLVVAVWAKVSLKGKFRASCTLIRFDKNITTKSDIPYLYQDLSLSTVLGSVTMRANLEAVIDSLKLKMTPEEVFGTLIVQRGRRTNILNISSVHYNRQLAVDIANALAVTFIKNYNEILNSATIEIYNYYINQRDIILEEHKQIQNDIENFLKDYNVISIDEETSRKNNLLSDIEAKILDTESIITTFKSKIEDIDAQLENLSDDIVPISWSISNTKEGLIKIKMDELKLLKDQYTDENPKVLKLMREIEFLEEELAKVSEEDKFIPDHITYGEDPFRKQLILLRIDCEYELSASAKKIIEYQDQIAEINASLVSLSAMDKEYFQLQRKEELLKNRLELTEERIMDIKVAIESNVSDFDILEWALPPKFPMGANRRVIAMSAGSFTFLGLLIFFVLRELLDYSMKSDYDFLEVLKIHYLGEIPNKDSVSELYFNSQIQILFGQIIHQIPNKSPKIIMFGSDQPETGKSFIIKEMIELFTSRGEKVLWIESILEAEEEIEDYLVNELLYETKSLTTRNVNVITENLHKCYFLCDEEVFRKALDKRDIKRLLLQLSSYNVIIWELFEAHYNLQIFSTISSYSDLLTFVARFQSSSRDSLENAIKFIRANNDIKIGGILNDVKTAFLKVQF